MTTTDDRPFLAADVGGTHARLGLVSTRSEPSPVTFLARHTYACADYPSLLDIIRTFLREYDGGAVQRGVLACAGYAVDGALINTNLAWNVDVHALRNVLQLVDLALINDFEAAAYGTQFVDLSAAKWLTRTQEGSSLSAQVVVGAGTGLGSAVVLPDVNWPRVLATEAGQIALAPRDPLEADILRLLTHAGERYVAYEQALSGPGLLNVYRALCASAGVNPICDTPKAVSEAAVAGNDREARLTLRVFYGLFGSFVGDMALLYNATGGITLIGGVVGGTMDFLLRGPFLERLMDKGRMRRFMETVPVRLVQMDELGLIGAAGWYAHRATNANNTNIRDQRTDTDQACSRPSQAVPGKSSHETTTPFAAKYLGS